jgi:hypothetical protein
VGQNRRLNYGARLTDEEYDLAIVALHSGLPAIPSLETRREVRRRELDLAIDHRLGREFPRSRRDALWAVQQSVEKRRLWLAFKYLLRRTLSRKLVKDAHALASYLVEAYATVLTQEELEQFFGEEEARHPALPVDRDQIEK